uniref:mannan endo-1,4-beta-mannosidase n=1 Tax=Cucumis sativus TaxID=3659 RepID=A0A0A0KW38_CUCSA
MRWVEEMGSYVKSIDKQHLVGIGMEGFYGDSSPNKIKANPGSFKFGTDFVTNNLNKAIDFATIHVYPDAWLPGKSEATRMAFLEEWMALHWMDSKNILKKPLILEEFGKSIRGQNQTFSVRDSDAFLSKVYSIIYNLARKGATMAGGLVWQVMAEGMESYYDGYEIVLSQNPSTNTIITKQSNKMAALNTRTQHHLRSSY